MVSFILSVIIITNTLNIVLVDDEGDKKIVLSTSKNVGDILQTGNISYNKYDKIDYNETFLNISSVDIERSKKVDIFVDNQTYSLYDVGSTLENLLANNNINVGQNDIVSLDLNTIIEKDLQVNINRVSYVEREDAVYIDPSVSVEYTPLLKQNATKTISEGSKGKSVSLYRDKVIDGQVVETSLISNKLVRNPIPKKVLTGDKSKVISPINFNGKLTLIKKNAVSTAYSAKPGAKTASGMPAKVGHVAVNPKIIPYGTKLYIKSSDGSFLYGYAVAADTGGFTRTTNVDIDLFFDSYLESKLFGKNLVDIYAVN
ncbi:MAG: ubiquitin-like domain-containing protein [Oscillospiraceae bacterium]